MRRAAVGLRKASEQKLGIKPTIRTGSRGELTVWVDGKSVFDHKREGAVPRTDELLRRVVEASQGRAIPAQP